MRCGSQSFPIPNGDAEAHFRLVSRLKLCINREWANAFLDLAKEIINHLGITQNDTRLVTSMPQGGTLPVIVNQRYVLSFCRDGYIGLIMPIEHDPSEEEVVSEKYFFRRGVREALWVQFPRLRKVSFSEDVKAQWKLAAERELHRGKYSGFRRVHEPILYQAIINNTYRSLLLDEAFPTAISKQ